MESLYRVKSLNYDLIYLVHSLSLKPEDLIVDANKKIQDYIDYRLERE
jgi:hypothetical protein